MEGSVRLIHNPTDDSPLFIWELPIVHFGTQHECLCFSFSDTSIATASPTLMVQFHQIVEAILNAGDSQERVSKVIVPLLNSSAQKMLASTDIGNKSDPFDILDPSVHSLGYLYLLNARLRANRQEEITRLFMLANSFSKVMLHHQVWLAPTQMKVFALVLSQLADVYGRPAIPIQPLVNCILQNPFFSATPAGPTVGHAHHLTPLHAVLLRHCVQAKMYRTSLPVLLNDITSIEKQACGLTYQDFLLYHYYGGMNLIAIKDYGRALEFFQLVVSAPTLNVVSAIQVEAHQKAVLVSLLINGRSVAYPKYTSNIVTKALQSQCKPYNDFAKASASEDVVKARQELEKHAEIIHKGNNLGLAKQCLANLVRRKIRNLTATYLTLSLADIAKAVGIEGTDAVALAEKEVLRLIESGEVLATISHADGGMVSFHDSPEKFDSSQTMNDLDKNLGSSIEIGRRIGLLDKVVGISRDYLGKVSGDGRGGMERMFMGAERFASGASFDDEIVMDDFR